MCARALKKIFNYIRLQSELIAQNNHIDQLPKIYLEIIFNYCEYLVSNNIQDTLQQELLKIAWDIIADNTTSSS